MTETCEYRSMVALDVLIKSVSRFYDALHDFRDTCHKEGAELSVEDDNGVACTFYALSSEIGTFSDCIDRILSEYMETQAKKVADYMLDYADDTDDPELKRLTTILLESI